MFSSVNTKSDNTNMSCRVSDPLQVKDSALHQDELWTSVAAGDTVPFSFEGRGDYMPLTFILGDMKIQGDLLKFICV